MSELDGSPPESSPAALEALVAEAKEHLDVRRPDAPQPDRKQALADIDWSRLESRIMASIEEERSELLRDVETARSGRRTREVALRVGALVLAAAAAIALFVRNDRDVALVDAPAASSVDVAASASSLRASEGSGEVRIGGIVAAPGHVLRAADVIEVEAARAVFDRPRKVTWLLEQDGAPHEATGARGAAPVARAHVKAAGDTLVLGLEHGVIEAQVVPVTTGEAFAVDIATEQSLVRVAVHGTHLRVARAGSRVVVDLTEGVVSIGVPPRTGVTYGTIVTAPAHVELDADDLGTLRVDHAPASVRTAIPLGPHHEQPGPPRPDPVSFTGHSHPESAPSAVAAKGSVRTDHGPHGHPDAPKRVLSARDAISAAVRQCAASQSRSGDVHVTVNSDLRLRVSAAGVVESAQFSPPLLPEIQSCAAQVIYKTKLEETGTVTIPIEFSY